MKYFHAAFFSIIFFISCNGQENKENIMQTNATKQKKEPIYSMEIRTDYGYEILVNGFPIARNSYITGLYTVPLNYYLYSSGKQDIEIRIYPKINGNTEQEEKLGNGYFNLQIDQREWTAKKVLSEPKIIFSYDFPSEENTSKKIFVHKMFFNADIPYKLTDWQSGKTFKEEDSALLMPKVLKYYEKLKYSFEHQEGEKYMQLISPGFFNGFQANYQNSEQYKEYYDHNKNFINEKERKLEPLENYKLQISGNGKLLSLRRIDGFNKGEGVLRFPYKKRGQPNTRIEDIVLYCPSSNSDDNDFQVVWYMNQNKGANQ